MKCRDIQYWLLTTKADAPLPVGIRHHLLCCVHCRRQQQCLERLDQAVCQLPVPAADLSAKSRLLEAIAKIPQHSSKESQPPLPVAIPAGAAAPTPSVLPVQPRRSWRRPALAAAAALLLITVGWLVGRQFHAGPQETNLTANRVFPTSLTLRLAKHDVQLATAVDPGEQVQALNHLAGELREEAARLAQQGTLQDIPLLADLYRRVAQQGVVRRALLLPADKMASAVPLLVQQFRTADAQLHALAGKSLPLVAQLLLPLENAARDSADLLEAGKQPPPAPNEEVPSKDEPAFVALVHYALQLAEETDPLRRADLAADVAEVLAEAAVALAAAGETKQADAMGAFLGDLLERGVADNLKKVDASDKQAQAESHKISLRSGQAVAVLEKNLTGAAPAAQAGLQKALQAASHGRDMALQHSKGKSGPAVLPGPYDPPNIGNGPGKGKSSTPTVLPESPKKKPTDVSPPNSKTDMAPNHKEANEVKGVLKSLDFANRTVTIAKNKKGKGGSQTFYLAKDIVVLVNGKAGQITDLAFGMSVHLRLSTDCLTVVEIRLSEKQ